MSAQMFQFPVAARPNFMSPAWLAQRNREAKAQLATIVVAPAASRPRLVDDVEQFILCELDPAPAVTFADRGLPEVNLDTIVRRSFVTEAP